MKKAERRFFLNQMEPANLRKMQDREEALRHGKGQNTRLADAVKRFRISLKLQGGSFNVL